MKALTIRQPWAALIVQGIKTIETRGWNTNYRGPLAIHAGAGVDIRRREALTVGDFEVTNDTLRGSEFPQLLMRGPLAWPYRLPLGAIVAMCELVDVLPIFAQDAEDAEGPCVINGVGLEEWTGQDYWGEADEHDITSQRPYGDFTPGRFAWMLENVKPCEPIPAKGKQGLWNWEKP